MHTSMEYFETTMLNDNQTDESMAMDNATSNQKLFANPFNKVHVRTLFIMCYAVVFVLCLVGNSMVLFAIARSPRLRSMTNFLLANLAIADFCVGVFCVLPNLSTFLQPNWILGKAMCKIYYYIWNVSYIGSITVLTVIAVERYIAILHPLKARNIMTNRRLVIVQITIWLVAFIYNIPYLIYYDTISFSDHDQEFCYSAYDYLNSLKWMSLANLVVWYIFPLILIGCMYYRVAKALWKTTVTSAMRLQPYPEMDDTSIISTRATSVVKEHSRLRSGINKSTVASNSQTFEPPSTSKSSSDDYHHYCEQATLTFKGNNNITVMCGLRRGEEGHEIKCFIPATSSPSIPESNSIESDITIRLHEQREHTPSFTRNGGMRQSCRYRQTYLSSTKRVAKARKKVIRLLISVVVTFGVCVLPHMMKVINHYWMVFNLPHSYDTILSPISFIVLYLNSVLNPFLYAMFSTNFRRSFKEALPCFRRKASNRKSETENEVDAIRLMN